MLYSIELRGHPIIELGSKNNANETSLQTEIKTRITGVDTLQTTLLSTTPGGRPSFPLWQDLTGIIWFAGGFIHRTTSRDYYRNDLWTYDPRTNKFSLVTAHAVASDEGRCPGLTDSDSYGCLADISLGYIIMEC